MGKALTIILIILLIIAICVGGVFIWMYMSKGTESNVDSEGNGLYFDPNAGNFEKQVRIAEQGVAIPGWSSITIPANSVDVTVDFYNPEANSGLYYMTFELTLSETGETLYKSGLVQPGLHIQKITLSRGLPAGTYNAVLHVQPYKTDAVQTPTNNANMNLKLIVK